MEVLHLLHNELVADFLSEFGVGASAFLQRLYEARAVSILLADAFLNEVLDEALGQVESGLLKIVQHQLPLDELVQAVAVGIHGFLLEGSRIVAVAFLEEVDHGLDILAGFVLCDDGVVDDGHDSIEQLRRNRRTGEESRAE